MTNMMIDRVRISLSTMRGSVADAFNRWGQVLCYVSEPAK